MFKRLIIPLPRSAELHERCTQIDKLRKRYEILMTTMAPPEGEEEHSAAYYVIAAAQVVTLH